MRRWLGVGVLGAAVVTAVVGLGISDPTSAGTVELVEIRLVYGELALQHGYRLEDERGDRSAVIELYKGPLLDVEGNEIGVHRCQCVHAAGFGWTCTHIYRLGPGPSTSRGTVVITGVFRGFNGERAAITGGTGAYAGATGYAVATTEGDAFVHTLHLMTPSDSRGTA